MAGASISSPLNPRLRTASDQCSENSVPADSKISTLHLNKSIPAEKYCCATVGISLLTKETKPSRFWGGTGPPDSKAAAASRRICCLSSANKRQPAAWSAMDSTACARLTPAKAASAGSPCAGEADSTVSISRPDKVGRTVQTAQ